MNFAHWSKIALVSLIASLSAFSLADAQRHGTEPIVTTGSPAGLVKKIEPEYPMGFVIHGAKGRGRFRLTVNAKTGLVDEVKIVQSTGFPDLNKLAVDRKSTRLNSSHIPLSRM